MADARDVLNAVADASVGLPITWVGHSFGGQFIGFLDHTRLCAAITVATGDGYWRRNTRRMRWLAPLIWRVGAPLSIRLLRYFPGTRLGVLGDLPGGVMRQWGRWCLHPEYLMTDHPEARTEFARVDLPLTSLSFTDDEILTADSITHLHAWYTKATQMHRRHSPEEFGLERIGHHGFFHRENARLWEAVVLPALPDQNVRPDA